MRKAQRLNFVHVRMLVPAKNTTAEATVSRLIGKRDKLLRLSPVLSLSSRERGLPKM